MTDYDYTLILLLLPHPQKTEKLSGTDESASSYNLSQKCNIDSSLLKYLQQSLTSLQQSLLKGKRPNTHDHLFLKYVHKNQFRV